MGIYAVQVRDAHDDEPRPTSGLKGYDWGNDVPKLRNPASGGGLSLTNILNEPNLHGDFLLRFNSNVEQQQSQQNMLQLQPQQQQFAFEQPQQQQPQQQVAHEQPQQQQPQQLPQQQQPQQPAQPSDNPSPSDVPTESAEADL